jgi:hypothetical protein
MPWKHGQKKIIAKKAGITQQQLSNFFNRVSEVKSSELALKLEKASLEVLGNANLIPWYEFMRAFTTTNKFFKRIEE